MSRDCVWMSATVWMVLGCTTESAPWPPLVFPLLDGAVWDADAAAVAVDADGGPAGEGDSGGSADGASEEDAQGDARGGSEDAGEPGGDATACPRLPECGALERLVGCECVSIYDRRCVTDADCRPDEECKEVGEYMICWWSPPPVHVCPGAQGCTGAGDPQLYVGAASMVVTPVGFETPLPAGLDGAVLNFGPDVEEGKWHDCGYDDVCPDEPGYPGPDEGELDGQMQGIWIAGFSNGRPAQKCPDELVGCSEPECCVSKLAHDDILVQIVVLRQADTTVAFAALDTVGLFHSDIERLREQIPPELGIDLFVMGATHNHEAPDTAGQWGPGEPVPLLSGRSDRFFERIRSQTLAGLAQAIDALEPVDVEVGIIDMDITRVGMTDTRTPYIHDNNLPVVRFRSLSPDRHGVATMVSLGNHPEVLWAANSLLTSDYPHFIRKYLSEGLPAVVDAGVEVKPPIEGFGGVTVFFAGAVGGLITPSKGTAVTYAGQEYSEHSFRMADAVGQSVALMALEAHASGLVFETLDDPDLRFATQRFLTGVHNTTFQLAAYVLGLLPRDVYNVTSPSFLEFQPDVPQMQSQTAVIRLGPLSFFTAPGEVFPELLCGGYPDRPDTETPVIGDVQEHHTPAVCGPNHLPLPDGEVGSSPCVVKPDAANPPHWKDAPLPPYGYDWVPGDKKFFIGLGMDFMGYFVPKYDYVVVDYFSEAEGDHYEETNGVGPDVVSDWQAALATCVEALAP